MTTDKDGVTIFDDVSGLAEQLTTTTSTAILEAPVLSNGAGPDPDKVAALKWALKCCGQCGEGCRALGKTKN